MQSGELFVSDQDQITIDLKRAQHPEKVEVKFKDHGHIHPCNPHHVDDLQWSVSMGDNGNYFLTISWSVSDAREIRWEACW